MITATTATLPQQQPALWWAFVAVLFSLLFPLTAHAVCSAPAAAGGVQQYEATTANTMEFCDDTNWVTMGNSIVSACATAGQQRYSAGDMQYCNGTNWISMQCATGASCVGTTAGTQRYNANDMEYCNGTNWISMSNTCP